MNTEELMQRLGAAMSVHVEKLVEIAALIRVLEHRGENLDQLKIGMLVWFRRIAYGQVMPEVFTKFRFNPNVLEKVASLPIPDQRRLSSGGTVEVLTFSGQNVTTRQVDPINMTGRELQQVFYRGRVRNLTEQRGWLEDKKPQRQTSELQLEPGVVVDRKRHQLIINGMAFSASQLNSYLSQLGT